jgi:prophage regulatory protein
MKLERIQSVIARTGLGRTTIYARIKTGEFPRPLELGKRLRAWRSDQVNDWILKRRPASTTGRPKGLDEHVAARRKQSA